VDREPMSDLVERLRKAAQEVAAEGHFGWGNRMQIAAARIEELERVLAEERRNMDATMQGWDKLCGQLNDQDQRIEELERALRELEEQLSVYLRGALPSGAASRTYTEERLLPALNEARAVLERGQQPSAAESVGEEIENVAIVTRTVKAGQGRVEGEP
jgi:chromosome segregation ATPase